MCRAAACGDADEEACRGHGEKHCRHYPAVAKNGADRTSRSRDAAEPGLPEHDGAPLTRAFMEQLFEPLRDLATLKQDITADIKDLKREVLDLGQRADIVEQAQDAREEELDCHRRELLALQDKI
ncbi:hypothetical protein NDU88_003240 [Pleurodeles waltl]|uniref:Uncharacterized protein n=1 Tax=Pleurodeles waltl TaxID=8319 RepID=A0AAV7KXZ2_PLEWA|nr:hypothetical protein NDU88_003240 [Pleurodeles waltl]